MAALDSRIVVQAVRVTQAILAIIVLGLTAYVAHWWRMYYHSSAPSQVGFLVFSAVWTFLALLFLFLVPWRFSETRLGHHFALLAVEAVTAIFWFAGFVALAVFLADRVCFGHVCSAAKAAAVFAAFEWVLFAGSTAMAVMHALRMRGSATAPGKSKLAPNVAEGV